MTYRATVHQTDNPANDYSSAPAPTPALALEGLRAELGIESHGFAARMLAEDVLAYHDVFGGLEVSIQSIN